MSVNCLLFGLFPITNTGQAGEVPRIQYVLADERHHVIIGNVMQVAPINVEKYADRH
jgi:hypothetical protein